MCRCKERQKEVQQLKQWLQTEKMSRESAADNHRCSEDEEQELWDETNELQLRQDEEQWRSADFDLEVCH